MEQHHQIRHVNTAEQRPLRILSLDGGGVRGYSMLLLLQEVMHKLFVEIEGRTPEKWEIPRPCDHFDMIGGTGTGGLIAILLGRLRLDIATALEIYADMTRYIFEQDKTVGGIPFRKTLYKASRLEEATKEVVSKYESEDISDHRRKPHSPSLGSGSSWIPSARRTRRSHTLPSLLLASASASASPTAPAASEGETGWWTPQHIDAQAGERALWYDERAGRCKTFVTAVYKGARPGSTPAILRTYESAVESCPVGHTCTIWEAARATCAVSPAFKPVHLGQCVFLDEGTGSFNPSLLLLEEIANEYPGREIGVFISVGSGKLPHPDTLLISGEPPAKPSSSSFRGSIIGVTPLQKFVDARENYKLKTGECEQTHLDTLRRLGAASGEAYFRLNVDEGVGERGMAEWARLADISNGTRTYLAKPGVQNMNRSAACRLAGIYRLLNEAKYKRLPRVPVPSSSPGMGDYRDYSQQPRSYASQPIIPNLATEFGKLHPPYLLHRPHSGPPATITVKTSFNDNSFNNPQYTTTLTPTTTTIPRRRPPPAPIHISESCTATTTTITSAPLSSRLPLPPPRTAIDSPPLLPLFYPSTSSSSSARIPDFSSSTFQLDLPLPFSHSERLPSLDGGISGAPSTASTTSTGMGLGLGIDMYRSGIAGEEAVQVARKAVAVGRNGGMGMGMVRIADGSGSQGSRSGSEEDEEVALHFRELKVIAGRIQREAGYVGERAYFNA